MNQLDSWEQDGIEWHQHVNPIKRVPIVHVGYYGLIAVPITSGMMPSVLQWTSKLQYIYWMELAARGLQLKHALWSLKGRFQHSTNKVTRTNTESKQPRLMEHGTTCMSCWNPIMHSIDSPKKKPWTNYPPVSSNMACRKIHHVHMCCVQMIPPANFRPPFSSGILTCYLWWPEGSGRLSVKKHLHQTKSWWPSGPSGIARTRTP